MVCLAVLRAKLLFTTAWPLACGHHAQSNPGHVKGIWDNPLALLSQIFKGPATFLTVLAITSIESKRDCQYLFHEA